MYGLTDADTGGEKALGDKPSTLRRLRSTVFAGVFFACVGGAVPVLMSPVLESQFRVETQLTVQDATHEAIQRAVQASRSRQSIDNVIRALDLGRAEEFSVNRPTLVRVVSELLSGQETTVSQAEQALRDRLLDVVSITYDPAEQRVVIGATAENAEEAAAITDRLAQEFRRALMSAAGASPSPQVEALRKTAARADAALSGFTGKLDSEALARLQTWQHDNNAIDIDIDAIGLQQADLQQKEKTAAAMTLADVLSKPMPDSLEFTGLEYQRQRYVQSQMELEQLSAQLGPRHPKRAAAQAAVDDAKRDIHQALRQLAGSLRQQVASADQSLEELKARKTAALSDKAMVEAATQLSVLQGADDEARRNLARAEGNSTRTTPVSLPRLRVVEQGSAASAQRLGAELPTLVAGGAAAGFFIGLFVADLRRRRQSRLAEQVYDLERELEVPEYRPEPAIEREAAPADDLVASREEDLVEDRAWRSEAANDTTFGDRMRALLLENRRPADAPSIPPLVAALIEESRERRQQAPEEDWSGRMDLDPQYDDVELLQLLRELAELKELARLHADQQLKATG